MVMASFDIESLFTNIPVCETINIAINALFSQANDFKGIPRKLFHSLLELSVTSSLFLFNQKLYKQLFIFILLQTFLLLDKNSTCNLVRYSFIFADRLHF